jgi:hypothetical protein
MHSSSNVNDGYLGSGRRIKAEVQKYGRQNFKREILEILPTRELLKLRESQIVTDELLRDPLCLNLKNGGEGGGKFWSEEHKQKCARAGADAWKKKMQEDSTFRQKYIDRCLKNNETLHLHPNARFAGKQHSAETKQKMRVSKNVGAANSQFGTCWINNGALVRKIQKDKLDEYLKQGYSRGRKT